MSKPVNPLQNFPFDVKFAATGVKREDGPTKAGLERRERREAATKEK